jgi:hypothetical protein
MALLLAIFFALLAAALGYLFWYRSRTLQQLQNKYAPLIDLNAELQRRKEEFNAEVQAKQAELQQKQKEVEVRLADVKLRIRAEEEALTRTKKNSTQKQEQLEAEYETALSKYKALQNEITLLEENLEDISYGLYKPHFSFDTSAEYKAALESARDEQRRLIKEGKAAVCKTEWTVSGSKRDGARMQKQYLKLMLRAFNGECDAAVANVSWNNVTKMEERIRRCFDAVNDLGSVMQMEVTQAYLKVRLSELRLAHEYQEKKYEEREKERQIREQMREEEKAQREFEKAREQAEREEGQYEKALAKARQEAAAATGAQLAKLTEQIASFETKLNEAQNAKKRAIARAQLTKSGFVYVISNVGSFGEKVFKIGMTRRMEPMDRIRELGDASVPFPFDLHVMLYSDNAPELESALHDLFESRRVNMVNPRKEFYHQVDLPEIEEFVRKRGLSAQFIALAEAKEYRETLVLRAEAQTKPKIVVETMERFAPSLFTKAAGAS